MQVRVELCEFCDLWGTFPILVYVVSQRSLSPRGLYSGRAWLLGWNGPWLASHPRPIPSNGSPWWTCAGPDAKALTCAHAQDLPLLTTSDAVKVSTLLESVLVVIAEAHSSPLL